MARNFIVFICLVLVMMVLAGCGETFNGMVKDTKRIGHGVKTIFIRDA